MFNTTALDVRIPEEQKVQCFFSVADNVNTIRQISRTKSTQRQLRVGLTIFNQQNVDDTFHRHETTLSAGHDPDAVVAGMPTVKKNEAPCSSSDSAHTRPPCL